jgi:hypothetical protein
VQILTLTAGGEEEEEEEETRGADIEEEYHKEMAATRIQALERGRWALNRALIEP